MYVSVEGRTSGVNDRRTDGLQTDVRTDGWTDGRTDYGRTYERTDERTDGQSNGRTDGRTDKRTNVQTNGWMASERTGRWAYGKADRWGIERPELRTVARSVNQPSQPINQSIH